MLVLDYWNIVVSFGVVAYRCRRAPRSAVKWYVCIICAESCVAIYCHDLILQAALNTDHLHSLLIEISLGTVAHCKKVVRKLKLGSSAEEEMKTFTIENMERNVHVLFVNGHIQLLAAVQLLEKIITSSKVRVRSMLIIFILAVIYFWIRNQAKAKICSNKVFQNKKIGVFWMFTS